MQAKTSDGNHNEADKHPPLTKETVDTTEKPASVAENNQVNDDEKALSSEENPTPVPTIPAAATTALVTPTTDGASGEPRKPAVNVVPPTVENKVTAPTTTVTASTEEGKQAAAE